MTSVRRRLLLGTAAATIAIFCAAAAALYVLARHALVAEFDTTLRARIQAIASMTEFDVRLNRLDAEDAAQIPEFQPGMSPEYFEIATADEQHVVRSASLGDGRIDRSRLSGRGSPAAAFVVLPDGRPGRAMLYRARTRPDEALPDATGPDVSFVVAKATAPLDAQLARFRVLLVVVCGVATVVLLALTALVIRSAMRPVERLALDISGMGATNLGAGLEIADVPRELAPVVTRLNELLGRLEAAFEREKCFTSDAAHELRTPLAGLAAALEICATERREPPHYERVVGECLRVVRQMHAMIDNLLTLARADAGRVVVARAPVRLGQLVREAWSFHAPRARERHLSVEFDVDDDAVLDTDGEKLSLILTNLLANAVQYVDDAGTVRVAARGAIPSAVHLTIANTGSRVRAEDASRAFDRFWRGDAARGDARRGNAGGRNCGLGLAVCRKLADALGATIEATTSRGGWFTVELRLPVPARRAPSATVAAADDPLCV